MSEITKILPAMGLAAVMNASAAKPEDFSVNNFQVNVLESQEASVSELWRAFRKGDLKIHGVKYDPEIKMLGHEVDMGKGWKLQVGAQYYNPEEGEVTAPVDFKGIKSEVQPAFFLKFEF